MKYLAILLHIYQPPTQIGWVVDQIANECYRPLSQIMNDDELNPKFTLNINYSLTEQLAERGYEDILKNFNEAAEKGYLEFTNSGAYHPIFPLIPEQEVIRQLNLNYERNKKYIPSFEPKGVFPPEMCYDSRLAKLLSDNFDYKWVITDDLPFGYYQGFVPYNFIPKVSDIAVVLRSNLWSNDVSFHTYVGKEFLARVKKSMKDWFGDEDGYIILAMDGETFGHHHKYYHEKFLRNLLYALKEDNEIKLVTISEIVERFPKKASFVPPSTWSATAQDLANDDPYPLWQSKFNPIHAKQWEFLYYAYYLMKKVNDELIRDLMDKALYSCQFWWASVWNFDPSQIYRGAFAILDVVNRYYQLTGDKVSLERAREKFVNIIKEVEHRQLVK